MQFGIQYNMGMNSHVLTSMLGLDSNFEVFFDLSGLHGLRGCHIKFEIKHSVVKLRAKCHFSQNLQMTPGCLRLILTSIRGH